MVDPRQGTADVPLPRTIIKEFDRINGGATSDQIPPDRNAGALLRELRGSNKVQGRDPNARGVYAGWPAMTPKYARHTPGRPHESFQTLARMYVRVTNKGHYDKVIKGFAEIETQEIAKKLLGDGDGAGYGGGLGYVDFLLQQAGHSLGEKFQVVETLSDNYVSFFFGQKAPIFNYAGTLFNTYQDDWTMRMYRLYRDIARGTQLARRGLLFYLRYNSMIVSGAVTGFNFSVVAETEMATPFTLQMLVKKVHILYNSLTLPTEVQAGDTFIPAGYQLVETKYINNIPQVEAASGDPATGGNTPVQTPNNTEGDTPVEVVDSPGGSDDIADEYTGDTDDDEGGADV